MSRETLLGVVEVATFRPFSSREKALPEDVLPVVAAELRSTAAATFARKSFSARTQEQAQRLGVQTQELLTQKNELITKGQQLQQATVKRWLRKPPRRRAPSWPT